LLLAIPIWLWFGVLIRLQVPALAHDTSADLAETKRKMPRCWQPGWWRLIDFTRPGGTYVLTTDLDEYTASLLFRWGGSFFV
jgi:hypothetical protein